MCDNAGLKKRLSSSWNPQLHAFLLEIIQHVLVDCLKSFNLDKCTVDEMDDDLVEEFLSSSVFLNQMQLSPDVWSLSGTNGVA